MAPPADVEPPPQLRSPLQFVDEPYTGEEAAGFVAAFRSEGWAVLPSVFDRASCATFRASIVAQLSPTPDARQQFALAEAGQHCQWEPSVAPRLRQILPMLLSSNGAKVQVMEASLHRNIPEPGEATLVPQNWHKDRAGRAYAGDDEGLYVFPEAAHCACYFMDMRPGCGATELIARSHRDEVTPADDPRYEPLKVAFNLRAEDCAVYDQRCFHRRGAFTPAVAARGAPDGIRLFLNSCFHQIQKWGGNRDGGNRGGEPAEMPPALARAWLSASAGGQGDASLVLGGRWNAASVWAAMEEARERDPEVAAYLAAGRRRTPPSKL